MGRIVPDAGARPARGSAMWSLQGYIPTMHDDDAPPISEILEHLPPYGPLPTSFGGMDRRFAPGLVVRFSPPGEEPWVGNFFSWGVPFDQIVEYPWQSRVLVIAGGFGYLIDFRTRALIAEFTHGIVGLHFLPMGRLLWWSAVNVGVCSGDGALWESRRLAWDGIRDVHIDGDVVRGQAWHFDDSWIPFEVSLQDGRASGGAYVETIGL